HERHSVVTEHRLQTSFASAICASAGPLFPTGKNSSGSSSRQTALWRQSIRLYSLVSAQQGAHGYFLRLLNACRRKGAAPLRNLCMQPFDRFTGSTDVNSVSSLVGYLTLIISSSSPHS